MNTLFSKDPLNNNISPEKSKPGNNYSDTPVEELSYEDALTQLEEIVIALESNEHPLDHALSLFERGQTLARHCASLLDRAELRVKKLSGEEFTPFNPES